MERIDARRVLRSVLKELRRVAIRMLEEQHLTGKESATGVNTETVLAWLQRYARQGDAGLESNKPGHALAQEWLFRTILTCESPQTRGLFRVKSARGHATHRPDLWHPDAQSHRWRIAGLYRQRLKQIAPT